MNPDFNICYIVGAMSLTPGLRPSPRPGDYVIAARSEEHTSELQSQR